MSFICGRCNKSAPAGTRCTLVKVETKEFQHPFRSGARKKKDDLGKVQYLADEGGKGIQTVKEIKVCVNCIPSTPSTT